MRDIKDQINLNQKKVLLRLDLNVPLENGKITDTTRIDKILPTINYLLKNDAKIIILSHVGRPKGKVVNELSLKPICESLESKLKTSIKFIKKNIKEIKSNDLFIDQDEKIVILENLRFYEEEEKNDNAFAKHLANLADIYVNDAFSCSHRAHASIFGITKFISSYAGLQLKLEIEALTKITSEIKKPITCIIGGSKVSSKINIIKNLIPKFDNIIIVGGMANNILKYKGHEIGKSLQEDNCNQIIEEIFSLSKKENCKIFYPEDVVVGKSLNGSPEVKELENVSKDDLILDIGPKTIKTINDIINKSNTVLWNGPAGYCENPSFAKG
uniref:phosphoglycerate kinase n=1 Tax=Candidatus Pelagibacter sp. TaxID=2024849 RepID=UPI00404A60F9